MVFNTSTKRTTITIHVDGIVAVLSPDLAQLTSVHSQA